MKKYKLLKELPGIEAGTILQVKEEYMVPIYQIDGEYFISESYAEKYPDFFEEITIKKTFDTLTGDDWVWYINTNGDIIDAVYRNNHCISEIFLTREEAEDEHKRREWANRKDKFIPKVDETYYYTTNNGHTHWTANLRTVADILLINQGLVFRTMKECQDAIDNHDIVRLFYTIR